MIKQKLVGGYVVRANNRPNILDPCPCMSTLTTISRDCSSKGAEYAEGSLIMDPVQHSQVGIAVACCSLAKP